MLQTLQKQIDFYFEHLSINMLKDAMMARFEPVVWIQFCIQLVKNVLNRGAVTVVVLLFLVVCQHHLATAWQGGGGRRGREAGPFSARLRSLARGRRE